MTARLETGLPENAAAATALLAAGKPALVWRRIIADSDTPVGAARRLIVPGRGDFLLESVEGGEVRGRYSLLGLDPDLVFRATGNCAAINHNWRTDRNAFAPLAGDALTELRALAAACRIDPMPEGLPPALACLVGYLGYETIGLVETLPRAADTPFFKIDYHSVPAKTNVLGAKGCGEAGCAGSLPSVMNAIVDALGGKHINMPATPERVWEALNS